MEASIQSDGSDFQFSFWEFSSDDPPVSPTLHSVDHSIDALLGQNIAASYMVHHDHDDANVQRVLVADSSGRVEAFGRCSFDEIDSAHPKPTSALSQFAFKPENDLIRSAANEEKGLFNNSKHDSPAASPSRRTATDYQRVAPNSVRLAPRSSVESAYGHSTPNVSARMKIPKSPHAHHYEQQRIREQQLSRKTFLPYRHKILSFCFFSSSRPVASY